MNFRILFFSIALFNMAFSSFAAERLPGKMYFWERDRQLDSECSGRCLNSREGGEANYTGCMRVCIPWEKERTEHYLLRLLRAYCAGDSLPTMPAANPTLRDLAHESRFTAEAYSRLERYPELKICVRSVWAELAKREGAPPPPPRLTEPKNQ